ncbi:MAG: hypothetical protein AAF551_11115, partial [Bacteroidota bacterium]
GWIELPYYLDAAPELADINNDESPLTSRFQARFPFGFDDLKKTSTTMMTIKSKESHETAFPIALITLSINVIRRK